MTFLTKCGILVKIPGHRNQKTINMAEYLLLEGILIEKIMMNLARIRLQINLIHPQESRRGMNPNLNHGAGADLRATDDQRIIIGIISSNVQFALYPSAIIAICI